MISDLVCLQFILFLMASRMSLYYQKKLRGIIQRNLQSQQPCLKQDISIARVFDWNQESGQVTGK